MNEEVLERLLESKRASADVASSCLRSVADGTLTCESLTRSLRAYILAKYHLNNDDCASDRLDDLSQASMEKMYAMGPDTFAGDVASNCDGADSAAVKHAFLILAIQKDFDVMLDGFAAGRAKTVDDIADLVFEQLCPRDMGRGSS